MNLQQLRERIRAVESSAQVSAAGRIETGWCSLPRGCVHEWYGLEGAAGSSAPWLAPLLLLADLAYVALHRDGAGTPGSGAALWIGTHLWPSVQALVRDREAPFDSADRLLLARSILIDPCDDAARLWTIDLALRCPAVAIVIADGSRLQMAHTRRLQLAAASGGGTALLARPPWERGVLSAAYSKWIVRPAASPSSQPRWEVACLHRRGGSPPGSACLVERDRVQGCLRVPAAVAHRPAAPTGAAPGRSAAG